MLRDDSLDNRLLRTNSRYGPFKKERKRRIDVLILVGAAVPDQMPLTTINRMVSFGAEPPALKFELVLVKLKHYGAAI